MVSVRLLQMIARCNSREKKNADRKEKQEDTYQGYTRECSTNTQSRLTVDQTLNSIANNVEQQTLPQALDDSSVHGATRYAESQTRRRNEKNDTPRISTYIYVSPGISQQWLCKYAEQ